MQPIYLVTTSSSVPSRWLQTNIQGSSPENISVAVTCNSSSAWEIDYTLDDVSGTYPNPTTGASNPTIFSSFNGSSNAVASFGNIVIAACRISLTSLSSAGGKCTATVLQSGIG